MCGIMGYIGGGNGAEIVYRGLKNLEYRGYDSAGVALQIGGENIIIKSRGRVEKLAPKLEGLTSHLTIGHTRWATHGAPSDKNAHPHTSGGVAIVHNGIVENFAELKAELKGEGFEFLSDTDSETIAHLVSREFRGDLLAAVAKAAARLRGSFAILAIAEGVGEIVVAKRGSPCILGAGEGENFISSDEPALAALCPEICVLEDGDLARVTSESIEIFDENLTPAAREKVKNCARPSSLELGNFPHYMIKEINEAPAALKNTFRAIAEIKDSVRGEICGARRIMIFGCGTAYHAGLIGRKYIEELARIPVSVENAGELKYSDPIIGAGDIAFAVSQSGETADTLEAAALVKSLGAKLIAVTNSPHSALARLADFIVPVVSGTEICVAATKSYVGQIAAFFAVAKILSGDFSDFDDRIADLCKSVIDNMNIDELVGRCAESRGVYFIGRGLDYAVALEGSLKLKEVSYVPGEGYPASELKHGTLALIDKDTTTVVLAFDEATVGKCKTAVHEVVARGGKAAVFTNADGLEKELEGVEVVRLPKCDRLFAPFIEAVAVQLLAYKVAVRLNRDPDKPRNLAKSVTVG